MPNTRKLNTAGWTKNIASFIAFSITAFINTRTSSARTLTNKKKRQEKRGSIYPASKNRRRCLMVKRQVKNGSGVSPTDTSSTYWPCIDRKVKNKNRTVYEVYVNNRFPETENLPQRCMTRKCSFSVIRVLGIWRRYLATKRQLFLPVGSKLRPPEYQLIIREEGWSWGAWVRFGKKNLIKANGVVPIALQTEI